MIYSKSVGEVRNDGDCPPHALFSPEVEGALLEKRFANSEEIGSIHGQYVSGDPAYRGPTDKSGAVPLEVLKP